MVEYLPGLCSLIPALQVKAQVARSHSQARESSFYPFFCRVVFVSVSSKH